LFFGVVEGRLLDLLVQQFDFRVAHRQESWLQLCQFDVRRVLQLFDTEGISRVELVEDSSLEHTHSDLVGLGCENGRDFGPTQVEEPIDAAVAILLGVELLELICALHHGSGDLDGRRGRDMPASLRDCLHLKVQALHWEFCLEFTLQFERQVDIGEHFGDLCDGWSTAFDLKLFKHLGFEFSRQKRVVEKPVSEKLRICFDVDVSFEQKTEDLGNRSQFLFSFILRSSLQADSQLAVGESCQVLGRHLLLVHKVHEANVAGLLEFRVAVEDRGEHHVSLHLELYQLLTEVDGV